MKPLRMTLLKSRRVLFPRRPVQLAVRSQDSEVSIEAQSDYHQHDGLTEEVEKGQPIHEQLQLSYQESSPSVPLSTREIDMSHMDISASSSL